MEDNKYYKKSLEKIKKNLISKCLRLKQYEKYEHSRYYFTYNQVVYILMYYVLRCEKELKKIADNDIENFIKLDLENNYNIIVENKKCNKCNSSKIYVKYDEVENKIRFYCKDCGTWIDNLDGFDFNDAYEEENKMNEITKMIFEKLGIEPNQKFYVDNKHTKPFKMDENLKICNEGLGGEEDAWSPLLRKLMTGEARITKKIRLLSQTEKDIIHFYRDICGFRYITKDENGTIKVWNREPYKTKSNHLAEPCDTWNFDYGVCEEIDVLIKEKFDFISYKDEEPCDMNLIDI